MGIKKERKPVSYTHLIQSEVLSGNEIRRDVGSIRHVGRRIESILSSCGEENREVFRRN